MKAYIQVRPDIADVAAVTALLDTTTGNPTAYLPGTLIVCADGALVQVLATATTDSEGSITWGTRTAVSVTVA